jgi:hypothetical protein
VGGVSGWGTEDVFLAREAEEDEDTASAAFVREFLVASCTGFCEGGKESASFIKQKIP